MTSNPIVERVHRIRIRNTVTIFTVGKEEFWDTGTSDPDPKHCYKFYS